MERRLKCECGNEIIVQVGSQATSLDCPVCGRELAVPPEQPAEPTQPPPEPEERGSVAQAGPEKKPCPFCLELIHPQARKCPFCQEYLDPELRGPQAPTAPRKPKPPTSGLAIASLILAILGPFFFFLTGPPAVAMGLAGLIATRRGRAQGRGLAIGGLIVGTLWTLALAGLVALFWLAPGDMRVDLTRPGEPLF